MADSPLDQDLAGSALGLARERSLPTAMESVVSMVTDLVPAADAAAVIVWDRSVPDASTSTDDAVRELLERHFWIRATPVLEAGERREPVYSGDLSQELRWRDFSRDLADSLGIHSVFAVPLTVQDLALGALAVFGTTLDAFDLGDREVAQMAALHATAALADAVEQRCPIRLVE